MIQITEQIGGARIINTNAVNILRPEEAYGILIELVAGMSGEIMNRHHCDNPACTINQNATVVRGTLLQLKPIVDPHTNDRPIPTHGQTY